MELAVAAARRALTRNKGSDWSSASGSVRARYLRAIAAKVCLFFFFKKFILILKARGVLFLIRSLVVSDPQGSNSCLQVKERKSELAKLEAIDCGKPLEEAEWDMVSGNS